MKNVGQWANNFIPLINLAEKYEASGQLPEAIHAFEDLLQELTRFSAELYRRQASALIDQGKTTQAYGLLYAAHKRDPKIRHIAIDLAMLAIQEGERLYSTDLRSKKRRTDRASIANLAMEMTETGIAALEGLESSVTEHVGILGRLYHLKCLYLCAQGKVEEASAALGKCLHLCPDNEIFKKTAEQLEKEIKSDEKRKPQKPSIFGRRKIRRNEKCPCGSGHKYKNCHGRKQR